MGDANGTAIDDGGAIIDGAIGATASSGTSDEAYEYYEYYEPDRTGTVLGWAIVAVGILIVTGVVYLFASGFGSSRTTPRTALERQIDMTEAVVKAGSRDPKAWNDYITALVVAKQYSDAQSAIDQGRAACATITPVFDLGQGRLDAARGRDDQATKALSLAIKTGYKHREQVLAKLALGGVTGTVGKVDSDYIIDAAIVQGAVYQREKRWAKVVTSLDVALQEDGSMADVLTSRGEAYLALGKKTAAAKDFRTALSYIPGYAPAKAGLKKIGASK